MKYAVIQTGGKQYRVCEGDIISVERLVVKPAEKITFSDVLLYVSDEDVKVGMPIISGMSVIAESVGDIRGPKIRVSKFKSKVRFRRVTGHRQALTTLKITQIGSEKAKEVKETSPKPITEEKTEKPVVKAEKKSKK